MKNKITLALLMSATALVACSEKGSKMSEHKLASTVVSAGDLVHSTSSDKEAAEQLAQLAEKMALNPGGFMYADEVLDRALTLDATNTRALFYKGLLAPIMAQKGILARMAPWIAKQSREKQNRYHETVSGIPQSAVKNFLFDGKGDITTLSDWQNHIDITREAFLKTRDTLKKIKNTHLNAHLTIFGNASNNLIIQTCSPNKIGKDVYEIPICPYQTKASLIFERPDFEALALGYTAYAIGTTWIYTAYNLDGLDRVAQTIEIETQKNGELDYKRILAIVKSEPNLLTIRNPQALKDILSLGSEGMEALRYALKHQPELCPQGEESFENRPGYFFSLGLCAKSIDSHHIMTLNAALSGPFQIVTYGDSDPKESRTQNRYITEVNLEQILQNPISDLREVVPVDMDPQTKQVRFTDETLGGLFPHGDASTFFNFRSTHKNLKTVPANELK